VDVRLDHETVWLTQDQMSQLFGRERSVITKHVRNVFREGELAAEAVSAKFAHTAHDGKTYQVEHYNLDVIISVGYRVKDHPFSDGNKRIGSFLFMLYLQQEGMTHQLNPQALTALALLIAESAPTNKDLMVRLIINLLTEHGA
jgi:hypothetical protein